MAKKGKAILMAAVFVVCVALVAMGQKSIGIVGLATMILGLAGLLVLLFVYNKKYV